MKIQDPLQFLGKSFALEDDRDQTLRNIKLIIRIRWIISPSIFVIMFLSALAGLGGEGGVTRNQIIVNGINIGLVLLLNVCYGVLARKMRNLQPLIMFQLFIDVLHYSFTVYKTGAVTSPFSFLYFMVIFAAAIMVSGKATHLVAAASGAMYSLVNIVVSRGLIPHQEYFSPFSGLERNTPYLILTWSFTVFSFFAFAALASYLTGLLRRRQRRLQQANAVLDKKMQTMLLLHRTGKALTAFVTMRQAVGYILSELLDHLQLDRAIVYLNIRDDHLHLYMVRRRGVVATGGDEPTANDAEGPDLDIPLREDAGLTAKAALRRQAYNIRNPE